MSFILDALKKSENDRQRQSGPALFEVRVPPPRSKFPLLAVAIVGLLVVNLGVVGWLMFREPAAAAVPSAPAGAVPAQGPPSQAQPGAAYGALPAAPGAQLAGGQQQPANGAQPMYGGAVSAQNGYPPANGYQGSGNGYPNANNGYPAINGPSSGYAPPAQYGFPANSGGFAGAATGDPSLSEGAAGEELNPEDLEPAREPGVPGANAGRVVRSTESGLPTYEEAAARTSIPDIHLDLHSYAPDPSKRFVLVNMKRLYEGQSLPEGIKLERITAEAAVMSYNGTTFVLNRD
jgi:general secretion pathway protein B